MAIEVNPVPNVAPAPPLDRRLMPEPTASWQSCFREGYPEVLEKAEKELIEERRKRAVPTNGEVSSRPCETGIGLALSGGGIRSATFSLGVLQALAAAKQFRKIDFLSTVSGGGYVGSFVGRLFSRFRRGLFEPLPGNPVETVEQKLADPYSPELRWLREHGRYVIPNGGGDILTAAAHVVRSWIALHFNLAAVTFGFFCLLAMTRGYLFEYPGLTFNRWEPTEAWFSASTRFGLWWSPWTILPVLFAAVVAIPIGVAFWLTQALSVQKKSDIGDLGPMFLAALWVIMLAIPMFLEDTKLFILPLLPAALGLIYFFGFFLAAQIVVPKYMPGHMPNVREKFTEMTTRYFRTKSGRVVPERRRGFGSFAAMFFKYGAVLAIYRRAGRAALEDFWRQYRNPMVQVLTRCRNLSTSWLGGSLLIFVCLAVVALIDTLGQTLYVHTKLSNREAIALGGVGGISAVFALLHKFADKLLTGKSESKPGKLQTIVVPALALILVTGYLTLCAFGSHILLWRGQLPRIAPEEFTAPTKSIYLSPQNYVTIGADIPEKPQTARARPLRATIALLWCVLVALVLRKNMAFLNLSSYQQLYAARLARAYLGASNPMRHDRKRGQTSAAAKAAKRISDPIPGDDCPMSEYRPHETGGPLHLVNVTINETVSGQSQIEQRDRKGLPMVVGPANLSVGVKYIAMTSFQRPPDSFQIQPVMGELMGDFHVFGGEKHPVEDLRLSNWIGISGAAFSTGSGAHNSFSLSLLTGLANVRLGYWWDCGIDPRHQAGCIPQPALARCMTNVGASFPLLTHLINELTGQFHGPARRRWYLSDGGHFENTGCYELLRRRLPVMIICDCGADPEYRFEDLSNLVRKARIDYDAEIEFLNESDIEELFAQFAPAKGKEVYGPLTSLFREQIEGRGFPGGCYSRTHAAIAKVRYDVSNPQKADGYHSLILLIKPSLTGDEPLDLLQYHFKNPEFPQEPTSDQFFDEAQWESYRRLGEHIGTIVFNKTEIVDRMLQAINAQRKQNPVGW